MLTITEAGKDKKYKYQIVYDMNSDFSTKYLVCDGNIASIRRYLFDSPNTMMVFREEVQKLDHIIGIIENDKTVATIECTVPGDVASYGKQSLIAIACCAFECSPTKCIPEIYESEFEAAFGQIPVEEVVLDNKSLSYRERAMRKH